MCGFHTHTHTPTTTTPAHQGLLWPRAQSWLHHGVRTQLYPLPGQLHSKCAGPVPASPAPASEVARCSFATPGGPPVPRWVSQHQLSPGRRGPLWGPAPPYPGSPWRVFTPEALASFLPAGQPRRSAELEGSHLRFPPPPVLSQGSDMKWLLPRHRSPRLPAPQRGTFCLTSA